MQRRTNILSFLLTALLMLLPLSSSAQTITRSKKQQTTTKTTKKSKQSSSSNNSGKLNKSSKTTSQKSPSRTHGMTQAQKDSIIQQAIDDMIWVEGGTFTMGLGYKVGSYSTPHQVTLSGYYISRYEVTQGLWQAVMGTDICQQRDKARAYRVYGEGASYPMYFISWNDCQIFLRKLNQLTGKHFRLPTEAEWEYAARGGNHSCGYKYSGSNDIDEVAWYKENSGKSTHPVGTKVPNELGLYDMSGNVSEWCADLFGSYGKESQTNPMGASLDSDGMQHIRTNRSGDWDTDAKDCRVNIRFGISDKDILWNGGFRLAM